MKLTPSAAMQLQLTDRGIYASPRAVEYLSKLDFSSSEEIVNRFNPETKSYVIQMMTCRKHFLVKESSDFLEACQAMGRQGQVVLMAAGASPLSIHLADSFPKAQVWDISRDFMDEKRSMVEPSLPNLHFIQAEVTDTSEWSEELHFTGFDPTQPSLFVLESLYFYMKSEDLRSVVCKVKELGGILCGDYMMQPEQVSESARNSIRSSFEAMRELADISRMRYYSRLELASLLDYCGYRDLRFVTLADIQRDRSGSALPFKNENGSPIEMWAVR
jgi:O-methyltransferase involved in polyketide biosynthesis